MQIYISPRLCSISKAFETICQTNDDFIEYRLRGGRTADEGRVELYSNEKWRPVCHNKHKISKTITEYCQGMGYADGIEVKSSKKEKNVSKCPNREYLHIRCSAESE